MSYSITGRPECRERSRPATGPRRPRKDRPERHGYKNPTHPSPMPGGPCGRAGQPAVAALPRGRIKITGFEIHKVSFVRAPTWRKLTAPKWRPIDAAVR